MAGSPRDMREYLQVLERQGRQGRALPALVQQVLEPIIDVVDKDKVRRPAAPVEMQHQTALFLDTSGRQRVRLTLDFPDVVFHTDGTPATIQQYELWGRDDSGSLFSRTTSAYPGLAAPGATYPGLVATQAARDADPEVKPWTIQSTNGGSSFRVDGYLPGTVWRFRVRALGVTTVQPGEWSEEFSVQMLEDKTGPQQPSAPVLTVARGTITATWDGQGVNGPMPADFKYAILAHGDQSSPTKEVARFGRNGGFTVITDVEYYDPQYFRVRAFDESGNPSPWSAQAVEYTRPLVDKDLILSTIDAAKTHLINVDAGVSILPNTVITEHLVVTKEMTAAIANFLVVRADHIDVNSLMADSVYTGLLDAKIVRSDMFVGKAFTGGQFTTTNGGRFQTSVEEYRGVKLDSSGVLAFSGSGVETFKLDAASGDVTVAGGTFTGSRFQTDLASNVGIKLDRAGLQVFAPDNRRTAFIEASTGNVVAEGTFVSGGSGSRETRATLDGTVFANLPGLRLDTGITNMFQPVIFGVGTSSTGYGPGNIVVMGSEQTANSSGRTELELLNRGGGFKLHTVFGPDTGMGIEVEGSTLKLRGSYPQTVGVNGTVLFLGTAPTDQASGTYTITYPAPVRSGRRWVSVTPESQKPVSFATDVQSSTGVLIRFATDAGSFTQFWIEATWVTGYNSG